MRRLDFPTGKREWAEIMVYSNDDDVRPLQHGVSVAAGIAAGAVTYKLADQLTSSRTTTGTGTAAVHHEVQHTSVDAACGLGAAALLGTAVYLGIKRACVRVLGADRYQELKHPASLPLGGVGDSADGAVVLGDEFSHELAGGDHPRFQVVEANQISGFAD